MGLHWVPINKRIRMRAIVLVKQVPDIRVGSVAMNPNGTIDRGSVGAITNPTDLHALEAALQLADEVWAISMGPKKAETALRSAIALGADRGFLLCDRLFAGSDTWATSNALAAAIRKIGGADLILAGTTALDGETGHVGPQVAQRIRVPIASGCEELHVEGTRLIARKIVEGGFERVSMNLPALVTVAETGFTPRYPTLPGRRRAAAAEISTLSATDLGLDETLVGLKASPTKVAHMEAVAMRAADCSFVDESFTLDQLAARMVDLIPSYERSTPDDARAAVGFATPSCFAGDSDVWVVCEKGPDDGLSRASTEILSRATQLAARLRTGVAALIIGSDVEVASKEASYYGADEVLLFEDPRLGNYRGNPETQVVASAVRRAGPDIVLFAASTTGRDLAPRVAAILDTGIAADCTDLYIGDWERRGHKHARLLHQVRPAMAGGVLATCLCPQARPQMATVRPGVFAAIPNQREPRLVSIDFELRPEDFDVEILERQIRHADIAIADADVVVAGGAGCGSRNWHVVEELAGVLGARVAASRAAVEAGLAPRSVQVGQTGATVRPQLYIACGISGALQHVVGMQASRTIIAINRDREAPIFHYAHFGVVGDVGEVIPELTGRIERLRRQRDSSMKS